MPDSLPPSTSAPTAPPWDGEVIFPIVADPVRRALLRSLALGGPQAATQLAPGARRRLDATLKHLLALRTAGLVTQSPDPGDKRRQFYALAPAVPLRRTPEGGAEMDFGFCLLRFSMEG
jgi:hypothetical protein